MQGLDDKLGGLAPEGLSKLEDFTCQALKGTATPPGGGINAHIAEKLVAFASRLPGNFYAIRHCQGCSRSSTAGPPITYERIEVPEQAITVFGKPLGVHAAELAFDGDQRCVILYVTTKEAGVSIESEVFRPGAVGPAVGPVLEVVDDQGKKFVCTTHLGSWGDAVCQPSFAISTRYIDALLGQLNTCLDSDVIARTAVPAEELNQLKAMVAAFGREQGLAAQVTIVDLADFANQLATARVDKDVHLIIGKSGDSYRYEFLYGDGLFARPTSKTIEATGEQITLSYSWEVVTSIRDGYIKAAIAEPSAIGALDKRGEATLNIFERGMWVVKTTGDLLAELKVPKPLWDEGQANPYPFSLEAFTSGLGDGAIDELKSVPDLLVLGLSMFDQEQREALLSALRSIELSTIGGMFSEKTSKYTGGGSVAWHEGGYDVVQVASVFYGGALVKGGQQAKGVAEGFLKVLDDLPAEVRERMVSLPRESGTRCSRT